ncbi:MAG TPA: hypothetical protein VM408_02350 [Methylomirabilota bacterium]|nr:hypothetical protein [Methylomirabilota bacterium]
MVGGEADIWVCGECRSVNNLRAKQCYHCRTPQQLAAVDPTAIEGTGHGKLREIALPEFEASRGEAMVASALIVLVAILNVVSTVVSMRVLPTLVEESDAIAADLALMTGTSLVTLGVAILALIAWAYWLSRVVSAMPALGLGYPAANALMAFVENFIPGLNLLRVPAIVRDVVRRLEPEQGRGDALIFAAWVGLFGGFLIPRVGFWLNWESSLEGSVRNALIIQGFAAGLVLVGAIFLVALIWWIEGRIALRRAEQLGEAVPAASAAGASAAGRSETASAVSATSEVSPAPAPAGLAPEPRPPTPDGTPTPFDPMTAPFAPPRVTAAAPAPTPAAAPFAPTPGTGSPTEAVVPGPLGSVPAAPTGVDAALHRPITAATGGVPVPTGPRLHLRIEDGTSMTATLDGESERITLDALTAAAPALARADGSVVIATAQSFEARSLAEQVTKMFTEARVPTTTEG